MLSDTQNNNSGTKALVQTFYMQLRKEAVLSLLWGELLHRSCLRSQIINLDLRRQKLIINYKGRAAHSDWVQNETHSKDIIFFILYIVFFSFWSNYSYLVLLFKFSTTFHRGRLIQSTQMKVSHISFKSDHQNLCQVVFLLEARGWTVYSNVALFLSD